jgi:hypothetical protein
MHYRSALSGILAGLVVGVALGQRIKSDSFRGSDPIEYRKAEPSTGPLRLDSLVLKREPGLTALIRYELTVSRGGDVTYRGSSDYPEPAPSDHAVLGKAGELFGWISPRAFDQLASLTIWPERSSNDAYFPPIDAPYVELTFFFSKVLLGEGQPEFIGAVENVLREVQWATPTP